MKKFLFHLCLKTFLFHVIFFTTLICQPNTYPADISFCIADLKYDGKQVKVCELGDGVISMFQGHDNLYKPGSIWSSLWDFLKNFDIPCWFVGPKPNRTRYQEISLSIFSKLGGRFIDKIANIEKQEFFKKISKNKKKKKFNIQNINESLGFVILKNGFDATYLVTRSMQQNPGLIFLDSSTKEFISSKYLTNKIFHDAGLTDFRPVCKSYPKNYTEKLHQEIKHDIPGHIYVIKPINSAKGYGIIMVEKNNLDKTLRMILKDDSLPSHLLQDTSYSHWKKDKNTIFLVEEFVESKPIIVDKKMYDPTMRVIFVLYNDHGQAHVNFLGAYWKLPAKSLEDNATLTECHKSKIGSGRTSSAHVDIQDFENVKQVLAPVLCTAYLKMLESTYNKNL